MIKELDHILDEYELNLVIKRDEPLKVTRIVVLPKALGGDGHPPKGKEEVNPLLHPLVLTGSPEELDEELADKLLKYSHVLKEGKDNLDAVEAEIKKAADEKKKKAAPKKKAPAKKKPVAKKKPTKAQLKEEARAKQAESKGQGDLFESAGTRLDAKKEEKDDLDESLLEGI